MSDRVMAIANQDDFGTAVSERQGQISKSKEDENSHGISLKIGRYMIQRKTFWPKDGQHILAQFDSDSIVVYQAFNPVIAEYAVRHQR